MDFDIFTKDITVKEIKENEGVDFIKKLDLDEAATATAIENFINKSILNLAQSKDVFVDDESTVRYLDKIENSYAIVVRKPFEQKVAMLIVDLDEDNVILKMDVNGKSQNKVYKSEDKMTDIIKAFNGCIKNLQK